MSVLCTLYARLQTGATEVLQLQILYYGAVRDLCGLRVNPRGARSPGEAENLLLGAQSVCRGHHPLLYSR